MGKKPSIFGGITFSEMGISLGLDTESEDGVGEVGGGLGHR